MPDVLQSIESGSEIENFYQLFMAMGPQAEAALPKLESLLADKDHLFGAVLTLKRMNPGWLDALPVETRERTASALYEAILVLAGAERAWIGVSLLAQMGEISAPYVLKLLRSDVADHRRLGIGIASEVKFSNEEILAELLKLVREEENGSVRSAAIDSVRTFGDPSHEAREALLSILTNPPPFDPRERIGAKADAFNEWRKFADHAARSLSRFGPTIIDELLPSLSPLDAPQRVPAIGAIIGIGAPAAPRLIELIADDDRSVAISAGVALYRIGPAAVPLLAKAVSTGGEQVICHAANALWWIGPSARTALPALLEVAGSDKYSDLSRVAAVRTALKVDLAEARKSEAIREIVPVLVRVLEKEGFQQQGWAAEAARSIGPPARNALPILRKRLESPHLEPDANGFSAANVQREARAAIAAIEAGAADD